MKRWDGSCGIGVTKRNMICDNLLNNTNNNNNNNDLNYQGTCHNNDIEKEYCLQTKCENIAAYNGNEIDQHPGWKYTFNGIGRIDPTFADPFEIKSSKNDKININNLIKAVTNKMLEIKKRYSNENVLLESIVNHKFMDDSKIRLGIKLARSMLLGDIFTVAFTGSSNTAGHDNMFMSGYPMQLQSILRPFWQKYGYYGASFRVLNHAIGGHLGTDDLNWCLKSLVGESPDVIFWESVMNDAGSRIVTKTIENHLRNSLSLPKRPVWHAMIAGIYCHPFFFLCVFFVFFFHFCFCAISQLKKKKKKKFK